MWLMVLLVVGTIQQKYIGLYQAQTLYFNSFIAWFGFVPTLGGYSVIGFISIQLLVKLVFFSEWSRAKSGIIITHMGVLLLLLGGIITAFTAYEGNMIIYQGKSSNYISDYHKRELIIFTHEAGGEKTIQSFPFNELEKGDVLEVKGLPISLEITKICHNCDAFQVENSTDKNAEYRGMAAKLDMVSLPSELEDEANRSGILFRINGAGGNQDGIYISFDFIDISPKITINDEIYNIALRRKRTYLPFEIELVDFEKKVHPGTNSPKSYKSDIWLIDGDLKWRGLVQMNEPLRYKGYTFFQSSFIDTGETEATIFAVVKNYARMFPYISTSIMCIGLLIHMLINLPKLIRRKKIIANILIILLFITLPQSAKADEIIDYDYSDFRRISVQDNGRIKPLDTFAKVYLQLFYGKKSLPNQEAISWLAELLFDIENAVENPIYNVANPALITALNLENRPQHIYSHIEISVAIRNNIDVIRELFTKPKEDISLAQEQLIELYNKTLIFDHLSSSFSLLIPQFQLKSEDLAEKLNLLPEVKLSYLDVRKHEVSIKEKVKKIAQKIKDNSDVDLSKEELELSRIAMFINIIERDNNSSILAIIPPQWADNHGEYFSPWEVVMRGYSSPQSAKHLKKWSNLAAAYKDGDKSLFQEISSDLFNDNISMSGKSDIVNIINLEVYYNRLDLFTKSLTIYLAAFIILLASYLFRPELLRKTALFLLGVGLLIHIIGIVMRMFIMGRPPVTTLYESILFVGLVTVIFGFILELKRRNSVGIIVATISGILIHFLGFKYDSAGDNMGMLAAVLDTNFWLATHVVTITIGYGSCFVGGIIAHIYLLNRFFVPQDKQRLKELSQNIKGVAIISLFFTALGTILGGIWADQSWGRFWGWDPKENGALLIVLWLIWLIHGRISGKISDIGFAVGMVITNAIVAIAWFGVNLLNVGLHSYGFTQHAALNLGLFCGAEILFAMTFYMLIQLKNRKKI